MNMIRKSAPVLNQSGPVPGQQPVWYRTAASVALWANRRDAIAQPGQAQDDDVDRIRCELRQACADAAQELDWDWSALDELRVT